MQEQAKIFLSAFIPGVEEPDSAILVADERRILDKHATPS
jgi:hypothetical protein